MTLMFCDEVLERIEAVAGGDLALDARLTAHLSSCANCRAVLDHARGIERMLQARPAPVAPAHFTSRTLARIRRDRWRRDQLLDAGFNTAVASLVLATVAGVWLVMNQSGMVIVSNDAVGLIEMFIAAVVRRIAPQLRLYAAATALLAATVGIWWWAERDDLTM
jgi:predicted anti-sigma-YlaC factor YlaD